MGRVERERRRWRRRFCRSEFFLFCLDLDVTRGQDSGFEVIGTDDVIYRYWYLLLIAVFLLMAGPGGGEEKK